MIADVLFISDHFVMVTTINADYNLDEREIENAAWDRLSAEYGDEWVNMTNRFINNVSIEIAPYLETNDGVNFTPPPGDETDAGIKGE